MHKNVQLKSFIFCIIFIAAISLCMTGCSNITDANTSYNKKVETSVESEDNKQTGSKQLGEGKTKFNFTVADTEGNETQFEIHTDEETVGKALSELGLIEGEEGTYGLYVKTVNGITLDYDKDGAYWAFYINGEYAQTGVDSTPIAEGDSYSFKAEKE